MTPEQGELLTLAETIAVLGISKQTLYRLMERGTIKGVKVGRQWRFRQADLDAYLRGPVAQAAEAAAPDLLDDELAFFYDAIGRPMPDIAPEENPGEAKVIRLVNGMLQYALENRASDIHLEAGRETGVMRVRVDGVLHAVRSMSAAVFRGVITRLKIMSNMNLDVNNLPQDGRIQMRSGDHAFDLRMNIIPALFGESAVLRILDQRTVMLGLEKLSFADEDLARITRWCGRSHGLLICTGPTGSGKTTTLYSCLLQMNREACKVVSIEDPVEYLLPGVVQMAVNYRSGMTFAVAMRAFLRHDPDIIMMGEVRDRETLEVGIQAALTGHLVLTTLHTSDAAGALQRMTDMGIERFLTASSVTGVLAQRLVRTLCPHCKQADNLTAAARAELRAQAAAGGVTLAEDVTFYRAVGCPECNGRGFRGRIALYELLELTPAVRQAFMDGQPPAVITTAAVADGFHTLLADGLRKAAAGLTTVDEVLRVVAE